MRAAVVTAIYDGYDSLKPVLPQHGVDVDWVCVTDKPIEDPQGWRVVVEPRPGQHPNVAAKRPKMLPLEYCNWYAPPALTIWVDASFRVKSDRFASDMADMVQPAAPMAQFRHPWRDCVFDEAEASLALPKYQAQADIIRQQMALYREWGHPEHWGLWATGVIVRSAYKYVGGRKGLPREHGECWLRSCQEWSYQDQLSEAVHLRAMGLRPTELPGTHLSNPWLSYEGSARH